MSFLLYANNLSSAKDTGKMIRKADKTTPTSRNKLVDRRSGEDRRQSYSLDYFENGGVERRISGERRQKGERRAGCIRVSEWSSVCVEDNELPADDEKLSSGRMSLHFPIYDITEK